MALIQITAAFCAVLILTIPLSSAMQVSVFMPGSVEPTVFQADAASKVNVDIGAYHKPDDVRWDNVEISINVVGTNPAYEIKKILLYRCQDMKPDVCIDRKEPVEAINYLSGEKGTFLWRDVSKNTIGNFLTFVQMEYAGKTIWVGYWDTMEREGIQNFVKHRKAIDSVSIHAKAGVNDEWIFNFFTNYFMIPGDWAESVTVETSDERGIETIYTVTGNKGAMNDDSFETGKANTDTVASFETDFMFVFTDAVSSPLTIFSDIPSLCGDGQCDMLVNENPQTCCLDCECDDENQECTATDDYPNGMCHVCGDGVPDAVENSTNCCVDAGCPEGLVCKEEKNKPYGICSNPNCGNENCERPPETVGNCCTDCGGSDACETALGSGFYCNDDLETCIRPVCGLLGCEPGENAQNCCTDCGGDAACRTEHGNEFYCNETQNVCIHASCDGIACEPGEEYGGETACCGDCDDCPVQGGNQLVCEQNVCHFCGNKLLEEPAENENTCCQDSGCSNQDNYCAENGACTASSSMGLIITTAPEAVDCTMGEEAIPITLIIDVENMPFDFKSFNSAEYIYNGVANRLDCKLKERSYECQIITASGNPDVFAGCFDDGELEFDVNATVKYNREEGKGSATRELTGKATVNVTKSMDRGCNKEKGCQSYLGESQVTCCHDCGCSHGYYCVEDSCAEESLISLEVDESSLQGPDRIKCSLDKMVDEEVVFTANIVNRPNSHKDNLKVKSYALSYNGIMYKPRDISLNCVSQKNAENVFTGELVCKMPMEFFPPCPYDPPQTLTLHVNITGGGLDDAYGTGMPLSDDFNINYEKGYQNCGDGDIDDLETSETCCMDAGCPENQYCAIGAGCVDESSMTMDVIVLPSEQLDCSEPTGKTVSFVAEISPKPVPKRMVGYQDTHLDDDYLRFFRDCDFGVINSVESPHVLQCDFEMERFLACFDQGQRTFKFNTSVVYKNVTKDTRIVELSEDVQVNIVSPMIRGCVPGGGCNPLMGEIVDKCCMDCGCTGTSFCTIDKVCNTSDVSLVVTPPSTIDCSDYTEESFEIDVINIPYNIKGTPDFFAIATMDGIEYKQKLSCTRGDTKKEYTCRISSAKVPYCYSETIQEGTTNPLTIHAEIEYENKASGTEMYINATETFDVTLENMLRSCTNPFTGGDPRCQPKHGETQENCCQDCGCSEFGGEDDETVYICTEAQCQPADSIGITIKGTETPDTITAKCLIVPTELYLGDMESLWDWDSTVKRFASQKIVEWECKFIEGTEFEVTFDNEPFNYYIIDSSYSIDSHPQDDFYSCIHEKPDSDGLVYLIKPHTHESESELSADTDMEVKFKVNLTIRASSADGEPQILQLQSNEIKLVYDMHVTSGLTSVTNMFKDFKKSIQLWKAGAMVIAGLLGLASGCLLHRPAEAAKNTVKMEIIENGIEGLIFIQGATATAATAYLPAALGWVISGVGLAGSFIPNIWLSISSVYLGGVGLGIVLVNTGWGKTFCEAYTKINYLFLALMGLEIAVLTLMNKQLSNLEMNVGEEMNAAELEVTEDTSEYWRW